MVSSEAELDCITVVYLYRKLARLLGSSLDRLTSNFEIAAQGTLSSLLTITSRKCR